MELEEVKAVHPDIECLLFPKGDYAAACRFFETLRDRFGKTQVREEDALRLNSLRTAVEWEAVSDSSGSTENLLEQAGAVLTFDFDPPAEDGRVLELVNKTNQFNLNGIRYTESDWRRDLSNGGFVVSIAYEDKFGPLGKIAVIQGRKTDSALEIGAWVMSCRAFSRRIEHRSLQVLFEQFGVDEIRLQFAATPKNGPAQTYFATFLEAAPNGPFSIRKEAFERHCPALYHRVEYMRD
jgi:FkbH-like protein